MLALLLLVGTALVQAPAAVVTIDEPTVEAFLLGPSRLRATVAVAGPQPESVVFQVDGVEVCRLTVPPYECAWDAGPRVARRVVRVVATFGDGRRATAARRTRDVDVNETTHVDSVLVSTHVTDRAGRFVPDLALADFSILEDGVAQPIELLGAGEVVSDVLVALDISRSMAPAIEDLKIAVREFLGALPDSARVAIGAFNSNLFVLAPFEAEAAARFAALDRLRAWGLTAINDTMIRGADLLKSRSGRRALVFFTDGEDVASRASIESARMALQTNDVLLYVIAAGRAAENRALRDRLSGLALETGGAAYFAGRLQDSAGHFRDIATDMANQYLLAFAPTRPLGDGRWRRLSVRVGNARYTVRARSGYFAVRRRPGGRP